MTRRTKSRTKPKIKVTRSNARDIPPFFNANRTDKIGIYQITFPIMQDGKRVKGSYVGQTKQAFVSRWFEHIDDLANNQHCNDVLTKAYKTYGINSFSFKIVEKIKPGWRLKFRLNSAEDYWIYKTQSIANERWSTQHKIRRTGHRIPNGDRPDHTDKLWLMVGIIGLTVAILILTII